MIWSKLVFTVCILSTGNLYALDATEIFKKVSPSIVVIKTPTSQGSGVATRVGQKGLTPNTYIISNCHVVKSETSVTVERLGKSTIGRVVFCDLDRDVALITIGGELPVVEERVAKVEVGEKVYAIGSPQGLELSISEGVVSQLRPSDLGKKPIIQTTAAISPGSSGGGLFDSDGRLVGITTLMLKDSQSLNFAFPASFVDDSIEANKNKVVTTQEVKKCGYVPFQNTINIFIEPCSLVPFLNYKSAWTLTNNQKPESDNSGDKYLSSTIRWVADCNTQTYAIKRLIYYKEAMATGQEVRDISFKSDELDFTDAVPNTIADLVLKFLCMP